MSVTNLPARRVTSAVVAATPKAAPVRRRRIGFFQVIAIAVILAFLIGLAFSLGQQATT